MHSSPLSDPIFNMDATNSSQLYDAISAGDMSPQDLSPHDTTGFAFNTFDGEPFANAENSFTEPLSATGSPVSLALFSWASKNEPAPLTLAQFHYGMMYDVEYTAEGGLPSPQTGGPSPASTTGSMLDTMHMAMPTMPEQQMQPAMVSGHVRSHPGSISSVASSSTAVSTMSNGLVADLGPDGTIIKKELSPGPMMGHVTPPSDVATLATDAAAPVEAPAAPAPKAPAKRKRENRYKNAPPAVLSRRRAQNRASQRAYRERKDQRIRDLENELAKIRVENESNKATIGSMHSQMMTLRMQHNLRMEQATISPNTQSRSVSMSGIPQQMQMQQQFIPAQQMHMTMMAQNNVMPMQQGYAMHPQGFNIAP